MDGSASQKIAPAFSAYNPSMDIKNRRERFLTTQSVGLKGKRQGSKNKKTSRSWFFLNAWRWPTK
jgi:hypothetical protein